MLLQFLLLITEVQSISLKFKIPPGHQQCIKDNVAQNTLIYGQYESSTLLYIFTLNVINQQEIENTIIEYSSQAVSQFHHVMQESGEISMCFEVDDYSDIATFHLFYESGAEIYDQDQLPKKQHVQNINETLEQMEQLQQEISREQLLIVDREHIRKISFVDFQQQIVEFTAITLSILIIVAVLQAIYIRRYAKYKKLS
ncbi:unnamed protein product (macronuclear) [Paramecium tetraurelia]|uniref:GOLD domain-containing protein n=1 Tax=Paramecium tetraurelia TaxID=5888 RepID=A0CX19_PARTE|nr:uncharacterized protein GSPATT00001539001 [Paramecium tetraurelia]CAK75336.1 unnamed protein product [Paramecium tetraurelia]|eukprot:XP_001442733.1 hypothetical protein (macronuclear) [Paramecium tetraurelia strain d4-2]